MDETKILFDRNKLIGFVLFTFFLCAGSLYLFVYYNNKFNNSTLHNLVLKPICILGFIFFMYLSYFFLLRIFKHKYSFIISRPSKTYFCFISTFCLIKKWSKKSRLCRNWLKNYSKAETVEAQTLCYNHL
jgi:hypothetical protein